MAGVGKIQALPDRNGGCRGGEGREHRRRARVVATFRAEQAGPDTLDRDVHARRLSGSKIMETVEIRVIHEVEDHVVLIGGKTRLGVCIAGIDRGVAGHPGRAVVGRSVAHAVAVD